MQPFRTRDFTIPGLKRRPGEPGDDATLTARRSDGVWLLAVADGIGSGGTSAWGAQLALRVLHEEFRSFELRSETDLSELLARTAATWQHRVKGQGKSRHESAATLGAAVISESLIGLAAIGDCFGVVERNRNTQKLYAVLDQGRSDATAVSSATPTLASRDPARRARVHLVRDPDITGVILSTDGLANAFLEYEVAAQRLFVRRVDPGTAGAILELSRTHSSSDIATALSGNTGVMSAKGDDIGVAVAVW